MFVVSYSSEELSAHAIHPRLRGGQQTFHKAKMAASGCGCQQSVWVTGEPLQRKSLEEEGEREGAGKVGGRKREGGRGRKECNAQNYRFMDIYFCEWRISF